MVSGKYHLPPIMKSYFYRLINSDLSSHKRQIYLIYLIKRNTEAQKQKTQKNIKVKEKKDVAVIK